MESGITEQRRSQQVIHGAVTVDNHTCVHLLHYYNHKIISKVHWFVTYNRGTFSWELEVCPGSLSVEPVGLGSVSNTAFTMLFTSWSVKRWPELVGVDWWSVDVLEEGLFHCFFCGGGVKLSGGTSGSVFEVVLWWELCKLTRAMEAP